MREHALPQDVVGYRFHIIGNMTLKQFAEVGAGCLVGFLIYTTNLVVFIKWPLILLAAGAGAAAAFVPFEERPLDQWILAFFRSLYRPTQFYWKRLSHVPDPFLHKARTAGETVQKNIDLTPVRRQRVSEYMNSIDTVQENDIFETYNQQRMGQVMSFFNDIAPAEVSFASGATRYQNPQLSQNYPEMDAVTSAGLGMGVQIQSKPRPEVASAATLSTVASALTSTPSAAPVGNQNASTTQSVVVPNTQSTEVQQTVGQTPTDRIEQSTPQLVGAVEPSSIAPTATQAPSTPNEVATQNRNLPFPTKPSEPNKVVGMALDANDTPLSNTIVEILTPEGIPARAVKTNALGQFYVSTPLVNGTYTIQAEKEGFTFPSTQLVLNNTIVDPIEIRSQSPTSAAGSV